MAPMESAQSFDNVGLLVGNLNCEVSRVLLALDLNREVLMQAISLKVQVVVAHHPLIFKPVKVVKTTDLLFDVVKSGISVIAMHTNLDCAKEGVSFCLATALGLQQIEVLPGSENFGRLGVLKNKLAYNNFLSLVSKKLGAVVKATRFDGFVQKVAVVSGAGGFALKAAMQNQADAFVTGECRHSDFVEAFNCGFALVAAGHFETEIVFCGPLKKQLEQEFSSVSFFCEKGLKPASCFYGDLKWL